jgi:hypothetical protein
MPPPAQALPLPCATPLSSGLCPALAALLELARSADPAVRADFTLFPDWLGWALNLEQ